MLFSLLSSVLHRRNTLPRVQEHQGPSASREPSPIAAGEHSPPRAQAETARPGTRCHTTGALRAFHCQKDPKGSKRTSFLCFFYHLFMLRGWGRVNVMGPAHLAWWLGSLLLSSSSGSTMAFSASRTRCSLLRT